MSHPWRNEDRLREMYHEKGLEQSEIADRWGCSTETISRWMRRLDIETEDHSERQRLQGDFNDEQWLREQYLDEERSIYDIAEDQEVSSDVIHNRLDEYGIERRGRSESLRIHHGEEDYHNQGFLHQKYIEEEMSIPEIAELCDASIRTIERHLVRNNIPRRSISDALTNCHQQNGSVPFTAAGRYNYWQHTYEREYRSVAVHRLVAVAEYGFDEVVGKDVHHKNRIPWDNRPENIELLTKEEHGRLHSNEYHAD